jgi:hypothetical protein
VRQGGARGCQAPCFDIIEWALVCFWQNAGGHTRKRRCWGLLHWTEECAFVAADECLCGGASANAGATCTTDGQVVRRHRPGQMDFTPLPHRTDGVLLVCPHAAEHAAQHIAGTHGRCWAALGNNCTRLQQLPQQGTAAAAAVGGTSRSVVTVRQAGSKLRGTHVLGLAVSKDELQVVHGCEGEGDVAHHPPPGCLQRSISTTHQPLTLSMN